MNEKKNPKIRGWFPTEPILTTRQASTNNKPELFARWLAIAVVIGTIGGALLGVVGSLLGLTEGIGVYAWPITTAIIVGACIGFYAVYMQRKLGLQTRALL